MVSMDGIVDRSQRSCLFFSALISFFLHKIKIVPNLAAKKVQSQNFFSYWTYIFNKHEWLCFVIQFFLSLRTNNLASPVTVSCWF